MHFLNLLVATVPLVYASTLSERSAASVARDLDRIGVQIVGINNTLNSYTKNSPATKFADLAGQGARLVEAINSATAAVNASKPFTVTDSLTIVGALARLQPQYQTTAANLISHEPVIATAFHGIVKSELQSQEQAGLQLNNAIASKVPVTLSDVISSFSPPLKDALNPAIIAYSN